MAAVELIAAKIGCSAHTLSNLVRHHEGDSGQRGGVTTAEAGCTKEVEREVRELKKGNEILH